MSSPRASLTTLPREILRHLFSHINSNTDAICLALTGQALYVSYVTTGALKNFNFGSRVATFNSLRARGVPSESIWAVLQHTGRGPPGYESADDDDDSSSSVESLD
jgi:hypothetical protein